MRLLVRTLEIAFSSNFLDVLWNIIALLPKMFFFEDGSVHSLLPLHATHPV